MNRNAGSFVRGLKVKKLYDIIMRSIIIRLFVNQARNTILFSDKILQALN